MTDTPDDITAQNVLEHVAKCAYAMSLQTGEPGVEIAGHTVSFLAAHPEQVERFMAEGNELWIDGTISFFGGALSYRCNNGQIRSAEQGRAQRGASQ